MTYSIDENAVYVGDWWGAYTDTVVTIIGVGATDYTVRSADGNTLYVFEDELTPVPATRTLDEVYALLVEIKEALNRD